MMKYQFFGEIVYSIKIKVYGDVGYSGQIAQFLLNIFLSQFNHCFFVSNDYLLVFHIDVIVCMSK
jgi:hypothetical protein